MAYITVNEYEELKCELAQAMTKELIDNGKDSKCLHDRTRIDNTSLVMLKIK